MDQRRHHTSLSLRFDYQTASSSGDTTFDFMPFLRLDEQDSNRNHFDVRTLSWTRVSGDMQLKIGIDKVFWGVAESRHLVDIINQTDLVENFDGEEKLGQPMINLSYSFDMSTLDLADLGFGNLDFYVLPGFRQRTFPGLRGRLALPIEIADEAQFESAARRSRTDVAVRWRHNISDLEFGLAHFSGTSRDPDFRFNGKKLVPYYPVIDQSSLDAQYLIGDWAWKLELLRRSGQGEKYSALVFGFEKTMVGIFNSRADLGLLAEYLYDSRGGAAPIVGEDDIALGMRLNLNDAAGSSLLFAVVQDRDSDESLMSLEASMRLGERWKLILEMSRFSGEANLDLSSGTGIKLNLPFILQQLAHPTQELLFLQNEDFIKLELIWYL